MEVNAQDIEGACHARLVALEAYFIEMSEVSAKLATPDQMRENGENLAKCLDTVREYRLHFDALRTRHAEALQRFLAGHSTMLELNHTESVLVDSITDFHESTMAIRKAGAHRRANA